MDDSQVKDSNNAYFWVLCSFVSFCCTNLCIGLWVPSNAKKTAQQVWKWKNIACSFLHSCITGIWAMLCFWQAPEMKSDLIKSFSVSAQGVISLSVGYFFYDLLDMAMHDFRRSVDLLIHHCLVILCFGLSVCTCSYQGYSLVALLVEVNSIFLHSRQLMLLYGVKKSAIVYKTNGVLNLATFVLFRVLTMGGMFSWLLTHRSELSGTVFGLGVFSLLVIMGMNFQLLFRVLKSDHLKRPKPNVETKHQTHTENSAAPLEKFVNGDHGFVVSNKPSPPVLSSVANGKSVKFE